MNFGFCVPFVYAFLPKCARFPSQNHLCVFGGMDASGMIKEQDYFTSLLDAREGRWHKRAIAVDPNLSGDYHGAFVSEFADIYFSNRISCFLSTKWF